MRSKVAVARFLIRFGRFIQSLAIMVMRTNDLIEFGRRTYAKPESVGIWGRDNLIDSALTPDEINVLDRVPVSHGRLLLLGVGGGREAVALGQKGFDVTGVDFIPQLVAKARENCARRNLRFTGLVQEISMIDVPTASFDVVWLGDGMYSTVPTSRRRVEMLKRIRSALKDEGYCICQFFWRRGKGVPHAVELLRKCFGFLTWGNIHYEDGDTLFQNTEFIHEFSSEQTLKDEFKKGGFMVEYFHLSKEWMRGGAILKPQ
jgi:SAM-dependent methyltransferase